MEIIFFKDFMKKYFLKSDTMKDSELQRNYIYKIDIRDSKKYSEKRFVKIDNGSQGGTHWICFIVKDIKSFYIDWIGGQSDKFLLNQVPKPMMYPNYKIQDFYSNLCG